MSVIDITKHDEADRLDWTKPGSSGIARAGKGDTMTLSIKAQDGENTMLVAATPKTTVRRYGPRHRAMACRSAHAKAGWHYRDRYSRRTWRRTFGNQRRLLSL